ncbi:hypothetical protein yrohd0001_37480 [Yersinia rohdei ATCC 43380]|nr:hypothetical protein yrohd0001_37480 [Yersinia rohdei ATCC 43380]
MESPELSAANVFVFGCYHLVKGKFEQEIVTYADYADE